MKCIFCKSNSEASKSIEHVIPESLGNKTHVLPKGMVCDRCNNYFAVKIESKVLATPYFKSLRHRNDILSKRGKLPSETVFVNNYKNGQLEITAYKEKAIEISIQNSSIYNLIKSGKIKELYIPIISMPEKDDIHLSRLLAKIALEVMAERISKIANWNDEFINHKDIECLRNYARYGHGSFWPYTQRKVYDEYKHFTDYDGEVLTTYQILHEYDYHLLDGHLIFICIILGVEYSIDVADRNVDIYLHWLKNNKYISPLLMK